MNIRHALCGITLICATAAITTQVVSQDKKGDKGAPPAMSPEEAAMMKKWEEFKTPGENHKLLAKKVGKWTGAVKMWMDASQPQPMENTATSEYKSIMGGRYISEDVLGDFMGEPFHGHGISGYDNLNKKFMWTWIDDMGTGFMTGEGTYDAATKTFKFDTKGPDPMAGKNISAHGVEKWIDDNHFVMEMWAPDMKTGKEFKTMEISYTRAK